MPASFLFARERVAALVVLAALLGASADPDLVAAEESGSVKSDGIEDRNLLRIESYNAKTVRPNRSTRTKSSPPKPVQSTKRVHKKSHSDPVTHKSAKTKVSRSASTQIDPSTGRPSAKALLVMATGYTAGIESTGKKPGHPQYGITFSGVKVRRSKVSTIAADPKLFPLGTLLYIPGYGYGCVADTGSRIKGRKIDLYFPSTRQVYKEWGKKRVEVQVIRWGHGKVTEAMMDSLNAVAAAQEDFTTKKLDS